jgi:hypothetical protein
MADRRKADLFQILFYTATPQVVLSYDKRKKELPSADYNKNNMLT